MELYRFNESIALNTEKGTIYLSHKEAQELKNALNKTFRDIKENPKFHNSCIGTIKLNK
jgi:hypothetical protein